MMVVVVVVVVVVIMMMIITAEINTSVPAGLQLVPRPLRRVARKDTVQVYRS